MRMSRGLWPLTVANVRSYVRDRSALFWTIAFPVIFVVLFGALFSGGPTRFSIDWVDQDASPASAQLRAGFASIDLLELHDATEHDALDQMREGKVAAVIVVPAGLGAAMQPGAGNGSGPFGLIVYTDPSQQTSSTTVQQVVGQIVGGINQSLSGTPPALAIETRAVQTQDLTNAAYFVPSILAMALMQLGIFASIPLTGQREKQILKRLGATPCHAARWS